MVGTFALRAGALAGSLALLVSCQAIERSNAESTEQYLAAAGFQMKAATTPEQLANLEQLTQRKVVAHEQDGQPRYVYADAQDCKCVYVGSEKNYDEYQRLSVKQHWGMWGPWGPWR